MLLPATTPRSSTPTSMMASEFSPGGAVGPTRTTWSSLSPTSPTSELPIRSAQVLNTVCTTGRHSLQASSGGRSPRNATYHRSGLGVSPSFPGKRRSTPWCDRESGPYPYDCLISTPHHAMRRDARPAVRQGHHGCSRPFQVQKRPCAAGVRLAITCRMPVHALCNRERRAGAAHVSAYPAGMHDNGDHASLPHVGARVRKASLRAAFESP